MEDSTFVSMYGVRNNFLNKHWEKIEKFYYISKYFWFSKDAIKKVESQVTNWEKIIATHINTKEILYGKYKEVNQKNVNYWYEKRAKDKNIRFAEETQMASKFMTMYTNSLVTREMQIKTTVETGKTKN